MAGAGDARARLGNGSHTLQLSVAEGPSSGATGPRCVVDALVVEDTTPSFPLGWSAVLVAGLLGALALLAFQRRRLRVTPS